MYCENFTNKTLKPTADFLAEAASVAYHGSAFPTKPYRAKQKPCPFWVWAKLPRSVRPLQNIPLIIHGCANGDTSEIK